MKMELYFVTVCPKCGKKGFFNFKEVEFNLDGEDFCYDLPFFSCEHCDFEISSEIELLPDKTIFQPEA